MVLGSNIRRQVFKAITYFQGYNLLKSYTKIIFKDAKLDNLFKRYIQNKVKSY